MEESDTVDDIDLTHGPKDNEEKAQELVDSEGINHDEEAAAVRGRGRGRGRGRAKRTAPTPPDDEPIAKQAKHSRGRGRGQSRQRGRRTAKHDAATHANEGDGTASDDVWGPWSSDVESDLENPEDLVRSSVGRQEPEPEGLFMELLPFQKEFLAWGLDQERGPIKGGILADEV